MAAYAPGPTEGDKEGCRSIIVKQGKLALQIATALTFVLAAILLILLASCSPCDPSTQPCDTDLSTRNRQQSNSPVSSEWCVWGAELVPCAKGQ